MKADLNPIVPFRWDVSKRERLGALLEGEAEASYPKFVSDLRASCVRVLALAWDCDLVFVGRSPESLYDYLRGVLWHTSMRDRLTLLLISLRGLRWWDEHDIPLVFGRAIPAVRGYLLSLGLDPYSLLRRRVAFVDLVSSGETFAQLIRLLWRWSAQLPCPWEGVRRHLRFVGLTEKIEGQSWPEPWHLEVDAAGLLKDGAARSLAIPSRLWRYLGDQQAKVAESHDVGRWALREAAWPSHAPERLRALRLAAKLFELGRWREERQRVARELAALPAMRQPQVRRLVMELRGAGPAAPRSSFFAAAAGTAPQCSGIIAA
jgi:hypothetical protein